MIHLLIPLLNTGMLTLGADCQTRQCYTVISACTADHFETNPLHLILQPHCLECYGTKASCGEENPLLWQSRDYRLYSQMLLLTTQGDETERQDARHYLDNQVVETSEGIFWTMKCISTTTVIIPNIFHSVDVGMRKLLIDWVLSSLEQHFRIDKFNQLWAMMPPYPGFARLNKPYRHVMQWSGKYKQALSHVIVAVFTATLSNPSASQRIPFTDAQLYVKNWVCFHLLVQYRYHAEALIDYMEMYLDKFHYHKDVFCRFCSSKPTTKVSEAMKKQRTLFKQEERESNPAWNNHLEAAKRRWVDEHTLEIELDIAQHLVNKLDFKFVTMHLLNHISDDIRPLGNLLNASSELPERAMMILKQAYRQWNHDEATFPIVITQAQQEVFRYWALIANTAKQCRHDEMTLTKASIKQMMKNPQPEIKTLDVLAECCTMPKGELQNHIS